MVYQLKKENPGLEIIINGGISKIEEIKNHMISELQLSDDYANEILDKLDDYMYIDEIPHFRNGSYIRWINLLNPNEIRLKSGATICDIELREGGTYVICKNNYGKRNACFQLKMDENLIFRKLNNQEKVLLSVMNYLKKS
jgi:tRNA-dihydrouridine synthase